MSDADLIARARQGDAAAFGELIDRHKAAVYRAALAALGSHADAEDAAQDAFVIAYRRLESFRGEASFKTWLLTIAWRQALNRRRQMGRLGSACGPREERVFEPAARASGGGAPRAIKNVGADGAQGLEESIASDAPSPEQSAVDRQLRRAIVDEIRALPLKLKDALLLAQSGEYSYDEIGTMLGAATGTIKWRVSEARKTIKAKLRARGFVDVG